MPKAYEEMDPELALKLSEGYPDVLSGETRKQEAFYRQFPCPRCGGPCDRHFLGVSHAFPQDGETLLPRSGLRCNLCDCVFDPHTGLIVQLGNPGRIQERLAATKVPFIGGEEA